MVGQVSNWLHHWKILPVKLIFFLLLVVHGRSDVDGMNMILQFKHEEENIVSHRGLAGSEHQTYTIHVPKNLRLFYEKLIIPLSSKSSNLSHKSFNNNPSKSDPGFEKMILTYYNINKFFAAFIDHVRI